MTMATVTKTPQSPGFGFKRIDREGIEITPGGMHHVIGTARHRALIPGIDHIKHQRCMNRNLRMQCRGRLPGAVAHPGDCFPVSAGG